jgi:hypothetical protein
MAKTYRLSFGAYGPASWVRNLRAAGEATLRRGSHSHRFAVEEVEARDAVPVLRSYIEQIRVTRPYFDATPDSPDQEVAAELSRHAVFRLIPQPTRGPSGTQHGSSLPPRDHETNR